MSAPQLEDGYFKTANELFDALIRYRIPGEQRQCFDFIIRKTYGFNKLEDQISNSQFVTGTGLLPANVSRSVKALVTKKLVIKNDKFTPPKYRINKHYSQWQSLSKVIKDKPLSKMIKPLIKSDNNENDETGHGGEALNNECSDENQTVDQLPNGQNIETGLLSKAMDTKDSNNVTKERGAAESGSEKQKQDKTILIKKLKMIASGRTDHFLVSEYADVGEGFPEMKIRAQKELRELERTK